MSQKLKAGILGGTGMVGQRFIALLENHPWFEVTTIAASPRSAGKRYEDAVGGRWKMDTPMPEAVKDLVVMNVNEVEAVASKVDFVFSAVDMSKEEIKAIEEAYAKTETPVVSNNSAHRWTPDVPMVVPEINPEHMKVIDFQKKRLGTERGFVAVKPNCSIQSYAPVLTAWKEFEPYEVVATTYQAISGAGKTFQDWPEMEGNIIPYIGGEEEKSEKEPLRIWGEIKDGVIVPAQSPVITCQCIRVPVLNGHTAAVFVKFRQNFQQLCAEYGSACRASDRIMGKPHKFPVIDSIFPETAHADSHAMFIVHILRYLGTVVLLQILNEVLRRAWQLQFLGFSAEIFKLFNQLFPGGLLPKLYKYRRRMAV